MAKRLYESDVRSVRRRGRPRNCWMDGVKEVLTRKGLNIQGAKVSVQDRNEWLSICRGYHAIGESPVGCMKQSRGWLWKLRSCWGSHSKTTVKNELGTHEFTCSSVGANPYWGKGQRVKKIYLSIYLSVYVYIHICKCVCVSVYLYVYVYR